MENQDTSKNPIKNEPQRECTEVTNKEMHKRESSKGDETKGLNEVNESNTPM